MKIRTIILAAFFGSITLTTFGFLVADCANAQTDIVRPPIEESGKYQMSVEIQTQDPEDIDVFQACCARMDTVPPTSLGCAARAASEMVIGFQVDIVKTPGDDAEVRCYVENSEDASDYSHNAYIILFPLRPNTPELK
jgi:hypothetical protein